MQIVSFVNRGYAGDIVTVEVDLRRGIPGMDVVGLPDSAVKEARERVRAAVRNSGFRVPRQRILINLAPAGVKKQGAAFDLPMAAALLMVDSQVPSPGAYTILIVGELELSGRVRPVPGVLAAVHAALQSGAHICVVPRENLIEARTVAGTKAVALSHLAEMPHLFSLMQHGYQKSYISNCVESVTGANDGSAGDSPGTADRTTGQLETGLDFAELIGQEQLKRACMVAAAGRHHLLLFGPPGGGKTMAALRFPNLLPDLDRTASIAVTRIYSIGGALPAGSGLITRPPFRAPHHTASREGLIGGGGNVQPGEISYAHHGLLFLDEALEFGNRLLQSLREPIERGIVQIARSGCHYWFPAQFQLLMATNACPCGKLGQVDSLCMCSPLELHRYWKKIGAAFCDRIDMRLPVELSRSVTLSTENGLTTAQMSRKVAETIQIQQQRGSLRNGDLGPTQLWEYCRLAESGEAILNKAVQSLGLSTRAAHSVLKISRTIADLEQSPHIKSDHIMEAVQYRRYGESDYYWKAA
ncbi:MAG: YifB family Mg chelatase-like AAA ATPase [Spirochaetaceae bacterium]|nr:YifB family Mg chelatase-like AAA ATPase [Spirochaetaceae bacterium]MCF7949044.1 YifB family Mg chelatase-like AAA ATPase [Spirochaetia bacterium]MCF7951052.1 YifB family Mg chelatase-like AAA ATPase [Spirochaetaceae bacterium]